MSDPPRRVRTSSGQTTRCEVWRRDARQTSLPKSTARDEQFLLTMGPPPATISSWCKYQRCMMSFQSWLYSWRATETYHCMFLAVRVSSAVHTNDTQPAIGQLTKWTLTGCCGLSFDLSARSETILVVCNVGYALRVRLESLQDH